MRFALILVAGALMSAGMSVRSATAAPPPENPEWRVLRPDNTGIPGEQLFFGKFDPQGRMWVSARWPFWGQGGLGVYDGSTWETHSTYEDELPSQFIYSIVFDGPDSAWIGTGNGLVRFINDEAIETYTSANSPLPSNGIGSLQLDAQGAVWMIYDGGSSFSSGIARFDGVDWQIIPYNSIGLPGATVIDRMVVDADGNIWVGTLYAGGGAMFDGDSWTIFSDPGPTGSSWPIQLLTVGKDGNLYADWNGLKKWNGTTWEAIPDLPIFSDFHDYSAIYPLVDGTYWIGTYSGVLAYYDGQSWTMYDYGNHLYSIDMDAEGKVWAAGLAQLKRLNADGTFTTFNSYNTGMPWYFVDEISQDADGHMWISTGEAGSSRFDGQTWRNFSPKNEGFETWAFPYSTSYGSESVSSMLRASDGRMWMASNGVAASDDLDAWNVWSWVNSLLPSGFLGNLAEEGDGTIWVASDYGAFSYDGAEWTQHLFGRNFGDNEVIAVRSAPNGDMWVATFLALHRWDNGTWTTWDHTNSPLTFGGIRDLAMGPDGSAYVATSGGLFVFDGANWTSYTEANSGIHETNIACVDVRADGVVAVGGYDLQAFPTLTGGVSVFDGETWTTYTRQNSPLPHNQVEDVFFDQDGHLWVSPISEGVAQILVGGALNPADLNGDGVVNGADLAALLAQWNGAGEADLNGDGVVDGTDLAQLLSLWGASPQ